MIFESSIVHQNGEFWVLQNRTQYTVYRDGLTHGTADSSYTKDADGRSIAIARCNYLAVNDRKNAARRAKHDAYVSCGMKRVRGALGGVYYE